jgi:hypothetical protein
MSKTTRTALHQAIRELFGGKLDTETDPSSASAAGAGSRIAIKWAKRGSGHGGRGGRSGSDGGMEPSLNFLNSAFTLIVRRSPGTPSPRNLSSLHPFHSPEDQSRHARCSCTPIPHSPRKCQGFICCGYKRQTRRNCSTGFFEAE